VESSLLAASVLRAQAVSKNPQQMPDRSPKIAVTISARVSSSSCRDVILGLMVRTGSPRRYRHDWIMSRWRPSIVADARHPLIPWGDAASPSPIQQGNSHTQARPIQTMLGRCAGSDFPGCLASS
jgi:hypothetical protein